jgi:hypothetical protein
MDSSDLPTIERIQHLARSILGFSEDFSTEIEWYDSVTTPSMRLKKMQASANEIKSLTQGLLEGSASQPRSFILFPMLPVELRLQIWKLALPGPRIVEVYLDRVVPDLDRSFYHEDILRVNTPPPALMHVNRESRSIALEKYWLRLGNEDIKDDFTRIDPAEDTIFIPWPMLDRGRSLVDRLINGTAWSEEAKTAVRSLAVDERSWRELCRREGFSILRTWRNILLWLTTRTTYAGKGGGSLTRIFVLWIWTTRKKLRSANMVWKVGCGVKLDANHAIIVDGIYLWLR